jgi:hypothetical protein
MDLADFDPDVVAQYHITHLELERVVHYVRLLQGPTAPTLDDIAVGGYYGTAALLHEVVELRLLLARDPELLGRDRETIQRFWRANEDAHAEALIVESINICGGKSPNYLQQMSHWGHWLSPTRTETISTCFSNPTSQFAYLSHRRARLCKLLTGWSKFDK